MRAGLQAVRAARATTVGTITLDSHTRVNDYSAARRALDQGRELNGFPLVTHGSAATAAMLERLAGDEFPVQVRHGTATPTRIFAAMVDSGIDATEGGPVSYCLPYSRLPLRQAIQEWSLACHVLAEGRGDGRQPHLESFGGCLLGQLCPPSLLIAISLLEGMFFRQQGITSMSLSYAQQTNLAQDIGAGSALRALASEFLPDVDWHVVIYTYMGVFPRTLQGANQLLEESVRLAVASGSERLIVKTPAEAFRIPTIEENVAALETAEALARSLPRYRGAGLEAAGDTSESYQEARALIEAVLDLSPDLGEALAVAFERGLLDVPYCLHSDNRKLSHSFIDSAGYLRWADPGLMPLPRDNHRVGRGEVTARELLAMLSYNQNRLDTPPADSPLASCGMGANPPTRLADDTDDPFTIAIVGMGPRGLSVFERLLMRLQRAANRSHKVEIWALDPVQQGAGRIWRTDQPRWLMMNTVAGQVTMYSPDQPGTASVQARSGPSLHEWASAAADGYGELGSNDFAPRFRYGQYLHERFRRLCATAPPWVQVRPMKGEVTHLQASGSGFVLTVDGGPLTLRADKVVLTTGHPRIELNDRDQEFRRATQRYPQLRYIGPDSAADMDLEQIRPEDVVAIRGLGL